MESQNQFTDQQANTGTVIFFSRLNYANMALLAIAGFETSKIISDDYYSK